MHLNKLSSKISIKIILLQDLIDQNTPDIFSLNKSNCNINEPNDVNPFKGYTMEHKLLEYGALSTNVTRTSIAIKIGTPFTRMYEYESDLNSMIWIKVYIKITNLF